MAVKNIKSDIIVDGDITANNLSGPNTGDQTSIAGITGTKAQFDTAVTDGNIMYIGDAPTAHTHVVADISDYDESKSITIESPTSSEDISMFFTNKAITITEIRAVVSGSTPSVTWTIRHGTDRSATGSEAVTSGTTTTSITTGSDVTVFNDATIVADSFVWMETTAQTGTVNELNLTIYYTVD